MIITTLTLCILGSAACGDVELRDVFNNLDSCSAYADDASAAAAVLPTEIAQLFRVKAIGCRDEQDS